MNTDKGDKIIDTYHVWYCRKLDRIFGRAWYGTPNKDSCEFVQRREDEGWNDDCRCHVTHIYYECPATCIKDNRAKGNEL